MNQDKFQCFLLKWINDKNPPQWELLAKIGLQVIEHIVEDEDQGPLKELGPYGWYRQPNEKDIEKGMSGQTDLSSNIHQV
jgi:hypothetical protein